MNAKLRAFLTKNAADGTVDIENEPSEPVKTAPAETPTEGKTSSALETPETPETQQTKFITDAVEQMLCQQIGNELFAYYEYIAAAGWFEGQGFSGFATWAGTQACGELQHMKKILDFLVTLGATPELPQIAGVSVKFPSIKEAIQGILERERAVTKNWRIIAKECIATDDAGTLELAQWFVTEQMEEEDAAKTLLSRLEAAGDGAGILVLDGQLAG